MLLCKGGIMLQSTDTVDHYWFKKKKPTNDSLAIVYGFTKAKNLLWSCICVRFGLHLSLWSQSAEILTLLYPDSHTDWLRFWVSTKIVLAFTSVK